MREFTREETEKFNELVGNNLPALRNLLENMFATELGKFNFERKIVRDEQRVKFSIEIECNDPILKYAIAKMWLIGSSYDDRVFRMRVRYESANGGGNGNSLTCGTKTLSVAFDGSWFEYDSLMESTPEQLRMYRTKHEERVTEEKAMMEKFEGDDLHIGFLKKNVADSKDVIKRINALLSEYK